ncbi:MAG: hypothetical protein HKN09_05815 [Saprospiraceae bacterium]|nr:hypothetical protein [Saprospiraceae bacterium]
MKTLKFKVAIFAFVLTIQMTAQQSSGFGFEFQAYPTGLIPAVYFEQAIGSNADLYARLGYNWIRHRDLGKHDDERGDGFGFSIGYKRFFSKTEKTKWRLGVKNDIWWNSIDWTEGNQTGNTQITVVQPTLELGYVIQKSNMLISPTLAFGYEVNVRTEGSPTGEGAILLLGVQWGRRQY